MNKAPHSIWATKLSVKLRNRRTVKVIKPLASKSCEEWVGVRLFITGIKTLEGWLHCGFQIHEGDQLFFFHYMLNKRRLVWISIRKMYKELSISRVGYRSSFAENPVSHPQPNVWNNSCATLPVWHYRGTCQIIQTFSHPLSSAIGMKAIGLQSDLLLFIFTLNLERRWYNKDDPTPWGLLTGISVFCHTSPKQINLQVI